MDCQRKYPTVSSSLTAIRPNSTISKRSTSHRNSPQRFRSPVVRVCSASITFLMRSRVTITTLLGALILLGIIGYCNRDKDDVGGSRVDIEKKEGGK